MPGINFNTFIHTTRLVRVALPSTTKRCDHVLVAGGPKVNPDRFSWLCAPTADVVHLFHIMSNTRPKSMHTGAGPIIPCRWYIIQKLVS